MTTPPPEPPPPIRVRLPDGEQEVTGRLHARRQLPTGWLYLVSIPVYKTTDEGAIEPAELRMWLRPEQHLRPVDGASYDEVPTEHLPQPTAVQRILGPPRPRGWVLQKLGDRRGPAQGVIHAVDCDEAPRGAPTLGWEQALATARRPGVRLCTLCGAAAELDPVLRGFGTEEDRGDTSGAWGA
ncbi:DUF6233 domain-containing protein [Streptomyces sp. NPDC094447]|uniref:DUF6233 domain-containing protein n=1 Tax=Streptomyces sp. NPDC094447 TaxID=3366062 RepID=UPI0038025F95